MFDIDLLLKAWPIWISVVATFVMYGRILSRVDSLEKAYDGYKKEQIAEKKTMWEKLDAVQSLLLGITKDVARIEGKLEHRNQ